MKQLLVFKIMGMLKPIPLLNFKNVTETNALAYFSSPSEKDYSCVIREKCLRLSKKLVGLCFVSYLHKQRQTGMGASSYLSLRKLLNIS